MSEDVAKLELPTARQTQHTVGVRRADLEAIFDVVIEDQLIASGCHRKNILSKGAAVEGELTQRNADLLEDSLIFW